MEQIFISCQSISKSYGTRNLFSDLSLGIFEKDRIGLIGRNGAGKSTLLKILSRLETADSGLVSFKKDLKIGYLPQSCDFPDLPIHVILMETFKNAPEMPEYEKERLVDQWLSKFEFSNKDQSAAHLSGGWKKRLYLATQLILSPDLLFLDEPTNHLDLETILWLEKFLIKQVQTYLLVSHDRYFLQNVTNRTIEIDPIYPKQIFDIEGTYEFFLNKKEHFLKGELEREKSIASKTRRESEWLLAGVKARTTKSQARIDEAHDLIATHKEIRQKNIQKTAKIEFESSERQTQKLLVAKNLSKSIPEKELFKHLDLTLTPGLKLGLMGPNGCGKTTLLRLLAGEILPDVGTIKRADGLQVVYFDQHRMKLPLEMTLREAISPNGDYVTFQKRQIHINGWCKRFLFSPDYLDLPIEKLSGGERARISIAHLMLQPADILLLDEPTNDLDIPTLEILEESILEFPGAIVVISHDRCMLDRICNLFLGLDHPQNCQTYSSFAQWENARSISMPKEKQSEPKQNFQIKKQIDQIERKIEKLELRVKEHHLELENPEFAQNPEQLTEIYKKIQLLETQIEELYIQWNDLM